MSATRASYAAIFDKTMGRMLDPLDPNLRFAADLYNYSLSQLVDLIVSAKGEAQDTRQIALVEGSVAVSKGHSTVDRSTLTNALVAFSYKTKALQLHNRRRGIGVPIITVRSPEVLIANQGILHPPVYQAGVNPVTLFVRFGEPWSESGDHLTAEVNWWHSLGTTFADVEGTRVPLEADTSLSLSLLLDRGSQYQGLLTMTSMLRKKGISEERGLFLLAPYDPDKIPILFVHGANGTPEGWKMIVEQIDRKKYQPWFYYYPSGFRLNKRGYKDKLFPQTGKLAGNEFDLIR